MILPNFFSAKSKSRPASDRHLFFAIRIGEQTVDSLLWEVVDGQVFVLSQSEKHRWNTNDNCIAAVDKSLQELGKESEQASHSLFILQSSWVNDAGILPAHKPLFQKMTKELSLEPVGFVVITEAIIQYLNQLTHQASFFFIDLGMQHMSVSLIKNGDTVSAYRVGRSGDSVSDVVEAFAHFSEKVFPAKIVVFSDVLSIEEVVRAQQQLIAHDWTKTAPFLHPPSVDVFDPAQVVEAVVATGARAVAEARGLIAVSDNPMLNNGVGGTTEVGSMVEMIDHSPTAPAEPMENPAVMPPVSVPSAAISSATSAAGMSETSAAALTAGSIDPTGETSVEALTPEEESAFLSGPSATSSAMSAAPTVSSLAVPSAATGAATAVANTSSTQLPFAPSSAYSSTHAPFHRPTRPSMMGKPVSPLPFILLGVISGVIILVIIAFLAAGRIVKASVSLQLNPKTVSKNLTITLDPKAVQSDPTSMILKASTVTQVEEGDGTADTTGTTMVGTKAKGKVTIFNYTTDQKTFPTGTKLSSGKVILLTDQAVTIASASTTLDSSNNKLTKPGSTDVTVTAQQVGQDSNLADGSDLNVESFAQDTYLAKTSGALTGGDSHQAQSVSQQDKDKLLTSVKAQLLDKADKDLKANSSGGQFYALTNHVKILTASYSAEVGKEATSLSLHVKLQVDALAYSSAELTPLVQQALASETPAGYQLSDDKPQLLSQPVNGSSSAQVMFQANASTKANPVLNIDQLKAQIQGKTVNEAQNYLQSQNGVTKAIVTETPFPFTFLSSKLPGNLDQITVTTE